MVKNVKCLQNCPNAKFCNALGKLLESGAKGTWKILTDGFLEQPVAPLNNILKLLNTSLTCDIDSFPPSERITCELPAMSNVSFSCSEKYVSEFEETLTSIFSTKITCSAIKLDVVDQQYRSIIACSINNSTCTEYSTSIPNIVNGIEASFVTLTPCLGELSPLDPIYNIKEAIKSFYQDSKCSDLENSFTIFDAIPSSAVQVLCNFTNIEASTNNGMSQFEVSLVCPGDSIFENQQFAFLDKIVVLRCDEKPIVLTQLSYLSLSECVPQSEGNIILCKVTLVFEKISTILIDCKIKNATLAVYDRSAGQYQEIEIKSTVCAPINRDLQAYIQDLLLFVKKQLEQGYLDPWIEGLVNSVIDAALDIFYIVCISHNIIFGAYLGTFLSVLPLIPVTQIATIAAALIPQAAPVLPYITFAIQILGNIPIPRPQEGFQIPLLSTFLKEIEDDLDSTSWLYLETCASKLLIDGEKSCFDPDSIDIQEAPEIVFEYIISAITTGLGLDIDEVQEIFNSFSMLITMAVSSAFESLIQDVCNHMMPCRTINDLTRLFNYGKSAEQISNSISKKFLLDFGLQECQSSVVGALECIRRKVSKRLAGKSYRLSGSSSGYYKSKATARNTLNQYPSQCSLKTRFICFKILHFIRMISLLQGKSEAQVWGHSSVCST